MSIFKKTIIEFFRRTRESGIPAILIGSANLFLQGIDISPRDIDISIPLPFKEAFAIFFAGQMTEPFIHQKNKIGISDTAKLEINGIEVEIIAEEEVYNKFTDEDYIIIPVDDTPIVCLKLEKEAEIYSLRGKHDKFLMIKEHIESPQLR